MWPMVGYPTLTHALPEKFGTNVITRAETVFFRTVSASVRSSAFLLPFFFHSLLRQLRKVIVRVQLRNSVAYRMLAAMATDWLLRGKGGWCCELQIHAATRVRYGRMQTGSDKKR